jgi:hypothetical protein
MNSLADVYLSKPLQVLALWQPWATLAVAPDPDDELHRPPKRHETRHWYPRGPLPLYVAMHAAKKVDKDNRDVFTAPRFREALKRCGFYPGNPQQLLAKGVTVSGLTPCPLGAIVGVATVVRIKALVAPVELTVRDNILALELEDLTPDDRAFGHFRPIDGPGERKEFRYAWELADTLMLPKPVPHTGRQDALYHLDLHTREVLNEQLRAMR